MKRTRKRASGLIKEMEDVLLLVRELCPEDQKNIARVIGYHVLAIEDGASMTEAQRSELRRLRNISRRAESEALCAELRRSLNGG